MGAIQQMRQQNKEAEARQRPRQIGGRKERKVVDGLQRDIQERPHVYQAHLPVREKQNLSIFNGKINVSMATKKV